MYSNIPIDETINITRQLLVQNQVVENKINEIVHLLRIILKQNYFEHNGEYYIQEEGLAMGSPISGTLANIYLNWLENNYIISSNNRYVKNIIYWYRYVDDILILFNGTNRQLNKLHEYINGIHRNIKFTLEIENNKTINFLDLTIINKDRTHKFKIYRKPTHTDHTIHYTSNHPQQHKTAAYNHMLNRLNKVPMDDIDYLEELNTIKFIANRNGYDSYMIEKMNIKIRNRILYQGYTTLKAEDKGKEKYVVIEYDKNNIKHVQNVFRKHGYKTSYITSNKLEQKLTNRERPKDTGVYKLVCNDCFSFYIGQTGRSFKKRFEEHTRDVHRIETRSNYAEHLKTTKHKFTDFETNLEIVHTCRKGKEMDRVEELEIYKNRHNTWLLNSKINTKTNKIYDMIIANNSKFRQT